MPKFGISFVAFATAASAKTGGKITTVTKAPVELVEAGMYGAGSVAAADIQHEVTVGALSAAGAGTGTSQTPYPFGPNTLNAAASGSSVSFSAEPTTYAAVSPIQFSFNQRGGMRWSVPRGEGLGNLFENTSMHIGMRVRSSAVGTVDGNMHFWE